MVFFKMGLRSIFSSDAELNKMNPDIFLSRLIHKAKIDVDEEGTVASAVTGKFLVLTSFEIRDE